MLNYSVMHLGIVKSFNAKELRADICFYDLDDMVITDMAVLQRNTQGIKDFSCLEVGEQVLCLLDEEMQDGYVLGSIAGDEDLSNLNQDGTRFVLFPDGGLIKYDFKSHTLEILSSNIQIKGNISVEGNITLSGDLSVNGSVNTTGNISADGSITDTFGNTNHHKHD